jgi:hypothetical protein
MTKNRQMYTRCVQCHGENCDGDERIVSVQKCTSHRRICDSIPRKVLETMYR